MPSGRQRGRPRPGSVRTQWREANSAPMSAPLQPSASAAAIPTGGRVGRGEPPTNQARTSPAETRSSSAPSGLEVPRIEIHEAPSAPRGRNRGAGGGAGGAGGSERRSVKHLTCFWWRERGKCRFSDEDCLYAHHDTGRYTEAPRQIVPGQRARAGRNLNRALRNLTISVPEQDQQPQENQQSQVEQQQPQEQQRQDQDQQLPVTPQTRQVDPAIARLAARNPIPVPEIPDDPHIAVEMPLMLCPSSPNDFEQELIAIESAAATAGMPAIQAPSAQQHAIPQVPTTNAQNAVIQVQAPPAVQFDFDYVRHLFEQGSREKAAITSAYERLTTENDRLKQEVDYYKNMICQLQDQANQLNGERGELEQLVNHLQEETKHLTYEREILGHNFSKLEEEAEQLTSERDFLREIVGQFQQAGQVMRPTAANPYGAIGSARPVGQHLGVGIGPGSGSGTGSGTVNTYGSGGNGGGSSSGAWSPSLERTGGIGSAGVGIGHGGHGLGGGVGANNASLMRGQHGDLGHEYLLGDVQDSGDDDDLHFALRS